MNWANVTAVIAGSGVIIGFFQWHVNQNYRRLTEQIRDAIGRQEKIELALETVESRIEETRDELHLDYVRNSQVRAIQKEIKRDFESVFQKLSGMSRGLSEIIGELRGRSANEHRYTGHGDAGNV